MSKYIFIAETSNLHPHVIAPDGAKIVGMKEAFNEIVRLANHKAAAEVRKAAAEARREELLTACQQVVQLLLEDVADHRETPREWKAVRLLDRVLGKDAIKS